MRDEGSRLQSFREHGWPYADTHPRLSARQMARVGFYRDGSGGGGEDGDNDSVVCYRCGIRLDRWNPDSDDPALEHSRYSVRCAKLALVTSYDVCGNNDASSMAMMPVATTTTTPTTMTTTMAAMMTVTIKHPQRMDRCARLATLPRFVRVPQCVSSSLVSTIFRAYACARRESLADAGFFCRLDLERTNGDDSGSSSELFDADSLLVCYACGVSLPYSVALHDISPARMHARLRPECWHTLITRGTDFVASAMRG